MFILWRAFKAWGRSNSYSISKYVDNWVINVLFVRRLWIDAIRCYQMSTSRLYLFRTIQGMLIELSAPIIIFCICFVHILTQHTIVFVFSFNLNSFVRCFYSLNFFLGVIITTYACYIYTDLDADTIDYWLLFPCRLAQ